MIPVCIVNDTSGENHTGCNAVMEALLALCKTRGLDVIERLTRRQILGGAAPSRDAKLVVINGEGSLHHNTSQAQFFPVLLEALDAREQPAVLINAVWDTPEFMDESAWALMHKWVRFVSLRESLSAHTLMKDWAKQQFITPDLSFWHYPKLPPRITAFGCNQVAYTDLLPEEAIARLPLGALYLPLRPARPPADYVSEMSPVKEFHTARFHGYCLAMMAGVPTITAYPTNTHKIAGLEVDSLGGHRTYCERAAGKIDIMMDRVVSVAREVA